MKKTFKFGRINKKEGINAFHQTVSSERTGTFPSTSQKMPDGSVGKESTCNAGDIGDMGLIPGLGRFPGEGNGNPFQYSCLENPMD